MEVGRTRAVTKDWERALAEFVVSEWYFVLGLGRRTKGLEEWKVKAYRL
jgi:hypothetical protein